MGADTITVTEQQLAEATASVNGLAKSLGLDMEDEGVKEFLDITVHNKATHQAWMLFYTNIVHKVTMEGHYAPGGCKHVHVDKDDS